MESERKKMLRLTNKKIRARALLICDRIDTRALEKTNVLAIAPLMLNVGEHGWAVVFRYGVIVLFDVPQLDEVSFVQRLSPLCSRSKENPLHDEIFVQVDASVLEQVQNDTIFLQEVSVEHLQLIAEILAKSVVLDFYEKNVAKTFDLVEPIAENLKRRGDRMSSVRELLGHIGEVLLNEHNMVGRVEVQEKPDVLWESPQLEKICIRLMDEFEIRERHRALERKMRVISRTAETMLDLIHAKRSLRVEWYIVLLIVVEICLTLYELFVH